MRFAAHVTDGGVLQVYDEAKWRQTLDKRVGKRVTVELLNEAQMRSNQVNRYWWGVCVKTVQECWHLAKVEAGEAHINDLPMAKEHVHDALVTAFGGGMVETPLGKARKSSASMTVEEFSALIEATADYLNTRYKGVVLPKPEEWSE